MGRKKELALLLLLGCCTFIVGISPRNWEMLLKLSCLTDMQQGRRRHIEFKYIENERRSQVKRKERHEQYEWKRKLLEFVLCWFCLSYRCQHFILHFFVSFLVRELDKKMTRGRLYAMNFRFAIFSIVSAFNRLNIVYSKWCVPCTWRMRKVQQSKKMVWETDIKERHIRN